MSKNLVEMINKSEIMPTKASAEPSVFKELAKDLIEARKELEKVKEIEATKREFIRKTCEVAKEKINLLLHSFDKISEEKMGSAKKVLETGTLVINKGLEENNIELIQFGIACLVKVLDFLSSPIVGEEIEKIAQNLKATKFQELEIEL
jgi:hypothetical protein